MTDAGSERPDAPSWDELFERAATYDVDTDRIRETSDELEPDAADATETERGGDDE